MNAYSEILTEVECYAFSNIESKYEEDDITLMYENIDDNLDFLWIIVHEFVESSV